MSFEAALRATECLFALALIQQSAEHMGARPRERVLFAVRFALAVGLLVGAGAPLVLAVLVGTQVWALALFGGPYNGGSDRMGGLILLCLTAAHWAPSAVWQEAALGYLGVQLALCYFMSGKVKLAHADWRSGAALRDVFAFSAYPVSAGMRAWARYPCGMKVGSWAVIGFEVAFPLALMSAPALLAALMVAATFHLANACVFGLNRFFWVWLAAFPSVVWFQTRIFGAVW